MFEVVKYHPTESRLDKVVAAFEDRETAEQMLENAYDSNTHCVREKQSFRKMVAHLIERLESGGETILLNYCKSRIRRESWIA